MVPEIICGITISITWTISFLLVSSIVLYLKNKPPGLQTLLDLVTLDTCFWVTVCQTSYHFALLVSVFIPDHNPAYIKTLIVISFHLWNLMFLASILVTLSVKVILIFRSELIQDVPDGVALGYSRKMTFAVGLFAVLCDQPKTSNSHFLMVIMTRDPKSYRYVVT